MKKYKFNPQVFEFDNMLREAFNIWHLDGINEEITLLTREQDQSTKYHKLYYELTNTRYFKSSYESLIKNVIKPIYKENIVYQTIPTFRICFPNNVAVGEWHKDKWYRNGEWAALVKEDNWYMPLTPAFDTNTIWAETEEDKGDYQPLECEYGELIKWDGCNLMHGNKLNKTGKTRISVDFRVIRYSNYIPSEHGSINMKSKFKIGEYYSVM